MLVLLSPAKNLDVTSVEAGTAHSQPDFLKETRQLVKAARALSKDDLRALMNLSDKLSDLTFQRFQDFKTPFTPENAKPAALTFAGDVYQGLDAASMKPADLDWAQTHVRIFSGLYGLLRPLDLIQPYRLEMGRTLATAKSGDLYEFWGTKLTTAVNDGLEASGEPTLINLASKEYFSALQANTIEGRLVTPQFKEIRDGKAKFLSFFAKKARGLMARHIIDNRINSPEALLKFNKEGYRFNKGLSDDDNWVFTRKSA